MKYVINILLFWYDFIVGDDWRLAIGVVIGLILSGYVHLWWLLPLVVFVALAFSLRKAIR